jgi:hypothetical protein
VVPTQPPRLPAFNKLQFELPNSSKWYNLKLTFLSIEFVRNKNK